MNKISNYNVYSNYSKFNTLSTAPNFKSKKKIIKEGSEIIKTSAPVLATALAAAVGINQFKNDNTTEQVKSKQELIEELKRNKFMENVDVEGIINGYDDNDLPLLNKLVEVVCMTEHSDTEPQFVKDTKKDWTKNTLLKWQNQNQLDKEYLLNLLNSCQIEKWMSERLSQDKYIKDIKIANKLFQSTGNPVLNDLSEIGSLSFNNLSDTNIKTIETILSKKDKNGNFVFDFIDNDFTKIKKCLDEYTLPLFEKHPEFIDKNIFELGMTSIVLNLGIDYIKAIVRQNPNISLEDLIKQSKKEILGEYEITNPRLANLKFGKNKIINNELYEIQELIEGIKDKKVLDFVEDRLKQLEAKNSHLESEKYLSQIALLLNIAHINQEEWLPIDGRKVKQYRDFMKEKFPDKWQEILSKKYDSEEYRHFITQVKYEKLFDYLSLKERSSIDNYLYEEYYLNKIDLPTSIKNICKNMNNRYNIRVFLVEEPNMLKDKEQKILDALKYADEEFRLWKECGKEEAKFPMILDFVKAKKNFIDETDAYGQGAAAGYATGNEFNPEQVMAFSECTVDMLNYALRHEMTHRNTETYQNFEKRMTYNIDEFFPKVKKEIDGKMFDFPDMDKIKQRKEYQEFKNAGISDRHISYAFNNMKEFIAVASEGDMSKYSDWFKEILLDFGMPEYVMRMPKNKYNINNKE